MISDQLLFDVLLMKVRTNVISFASKKKRENEEKEKILENNIQQLQSNTSLTDSEKRKFDKNKKELNFIKRE